MADADSSDLADLAAQLQASCLARGATVATAESCTGGLVAETLTRVPGSSGYVLGGVVAYANAIKEAQLGVGSSVLAAHGAVSAQVAIAMADGCRARLGSTLAVSVTGIAGPDGGSPAKPVGLVYVAVAAAGRQTQVRRCVFAGDRQAIRAAATVEAIRLLLDAAASLSSSPGR